MFRFLVVVALLLSSARARANTIWELGDFQTNSNTFVEIAPRLTITADAGSDLLLFFTADLSSSTSGTPAMEFFIGNDVGNSVWARGAVSGVPPNTPVPLTAFDFTVGTTGELRFQLRAVSTNSTAFVRDLKVIAIEVPQPDLRFVENLARADVPPGGWVPLLTLPLPGPGTWTILSGATALSARDGVALRTVGASRPIPSTFGDGDIRTFSLLNRPGWQPVMTVSTQALMGASAITLEAMAAPSNDGGVGVGPMTSLIDLRLAAFDTTSVQSTGVGLQGVSVVSTGTAAILDMPQSTTAGTAYLQLQHLHAAATVESFTTVRLEGLRTVTLASGSALETHHLSATSATAWVSAGAMVSSRLVAIGSPANATVAWAGASALFVLPGGLTVMRDGGADAGSPVDGGALIDAGTLVDAGPVDAGTPVDAGLVDAGTPAADAGAPLDAGLPTDAGTVGAADGGAPQPANYAVGCSCSTSDPSALLLAFTWLMTRRRGA